MAIWERKCGEDEAEVWRGESGSVARTRRKCGEVRAEVWQGRGGSVAM